MKNVKVLGSGCANCVRTASLIEQVARENGVGITLEKIEDYPTIASFGVMTTPAVVVDGQVVHAGGVPSRDRVASWL